MSEVPLYRAALQIHFQGENKRLYLMSTGLKFPVVAQLLSNAEKDFFVDNLLV